MGKVPDFADVCSLSGRKKTIPTALAMPQAIPAGSDSPTCRISASGLSALSRTRRVNWECPVQGANLTRITSPRGARLPSHALRAQRTDYRPHPHASSAPCNVVELLAFYLPRCNCDPNAIVRRMRAHHAQRQRSIDHHRQRAMHVTT